MVTKKFFFLFSVLLSMVGTNVLAVNEAASKDDTVSVNYLHLEDIEIEPGETKEVEMLLTNAYEVAGVNGNIKLPEGLSFVMKKKDKLDAKSIDDRAEDFTLSCALQEDGSAKFAQYSGDGWTYDEKEGAIFTFKIKAAEDATSGTYTITLSEVVLSIVCSDETTKGYEIPDRTGTLTVKGTAGIGTLKEENSKDGSYYTLGGSKQQGKPTQKGVYIHKGKKMIVNR
jgi:hypothetical protein